MNARAELLELCGWFGWRAGIREPGSLWLSACPPRRIAEVGRRNFGGDAEAINRHSVRLYIADNSLALRLDKTLDLCPPCYRLEVFPLWLIGVLPTLKIDGEDFWGEGESWEWAVERMLRALKVALVPAHQVRNWFSPEDIEEIRDYAISGKYDIDPDWPGQAVFHTNEGK